MLISQKCQYALRAVFELAKNYGEKPVKIGDIAAAQAIPARFLEVILGELKQGGFVESRRGPEGGYRLVRQPSRVNVEEIIQFIEGPIGPVECVKDDPEQRCPLRGSCVFMPMWKKVQKAMADIYRSTSFQDLVEEEARKDEDFVLTYTI